jgi:type IV pilus assembly protein PilQ
MKKYLSKIFLVFIILIWVFTYIPVISLAAETADKNNASENKTAAVVDNVGNLENILFAKFPGKERIQLVVSQQPVIDVKSKINGSFLIKLENMSAPESLCRSLGEGELNNVISVTPSQQLIKGKQFVYITIDIKKIVPYAIRQEGQNLLIDFNVSGLVEKKARVSQKRIATKKVAAKGREKTAKNRDDIAKDEARVTPVKMETVKRSTDRIISIDFQEADIKSVLRLMAEYGNVSIVSSDDVKGNVTLSMKNVPWKQALDTILEVNSLAKKQTDNVITVTTLERKKKDEADRVKAADDQNKADDERKAREQKMLAEKGLLKQVLIEAKIVEATEDFVRNIGVQWGFGNQQKVSGNYGLGVTGGSNTSTTNPYYQAYPTQTLESGGLPPINTQPSVTSLYQAAVNFPTTLASPTIGLVFGGASGFLETQLAALETNGTGKLISSPKIVTMEGIKAVIKQGAEVPYTTPASGTSPATVSFKEALLSLEVTPKITDEGKISMEIKASNNSPDYANTVLGNPPIKKSEVESKVVISDGDTIVIGGVMVTNETKAVSGWPWLQQVPVLGWLFKTENINKGKKQLLIFVTPRILKGDSFKESAEKIIN